MSNWTSKTPDRVAAIRGAICGSANPPLFLWPPISLPRTALQACVDCGGPSGGISPLLLVPALSHWPVPRRCRTGHRKHLTELLQFAEPSADQRILPCSCGHQSHYRELRSKPVLTAVGQAEASRPYYLCPDCHNGQFPADVELDIVHTEFSP